MFDVTTRYDLERELGRGGMGTVYRARDRETGALVAIKVLRRKLVRDQLRFSREVGVLATLDHPGIVRYLGHGELPNGKPALIMEWVEGESLSQRMAMHGMSLVEAVATLTQVTDALAYAHQHGIVHRDIKPDNILFVGGGEDRVKLIDFGIARRIGDTLNLTRTGMRIGTPCYMSPEQARGARDIDARADVFVLGCVLYECVTGHRAFAAGNVQALLFKIIVSDPVAVEHSCPEVPAQLVDLIGRMMAKDPEQRPVDAQAVLDELTALPIMPDGPTRQLAAAEDDDEVPATQLVTRLDRKIQPAEQTTFVMLMVPPEDDEIDPDEDTVEDTARDNLVQALRGEAESRGMRVEVLANGSILGVLSGTESPSALATRLAECALSIKRWAPDVSVAFLSDCRGSAREPIGRTLERGFANLETAALRALTLAAGGGETGVIHLDETTARLLDGKFTVVQDENRYQLVATGGGEAY